MWIVGTHRSAEVRLVEQVVPAAGQSARLQVHWVLLLLDTTPPIEQREAGDDRVVDGDCRPRRSMKSRASRCYLGCPVSTVKFTCSVNELVRVSHQTQQLQEVRLVIQFSDAVRTEF